VYGTFDTFEDELLLAQIQAIRIDLTIESGPHAYGAANIGPLAKNSLKLASYVYNTRHVKWTTSKITH
jgi:hypothetical protein